ncbi:DUF2559 domain-containing protein [Marinobacter sp. R17]|uniref:YhfG family protein n=1 Tax=Marinobacter sp. R17 TaxID=2484250 RepID=UPI000F4C85AF|nr:YhfG family protein [Marinobacter sp. R17]ROT96193.1 DUF2559 domain-containing protein [Marinobacter sp. R17]
MPNLKAKKDYFAKVRRSNYVASMRLEDMPVCRRDVFRKLKTREAVLKAHGYKDDY